MRRTVKGNVANMVGVKALQNQKVITLHVKGMGAITSAEEIRAVLEEKTCDTKEVEVRALRPMRIGSQAATIKLDKKIEKLNTMSIQLVAIKITI